MRQYLIDTFRFNDWAQRRMLDAILALPEKNDAVAVFSHIIAAQDKWMRRVKGDPNEPQMPWWETYDASELEPRWTTSLNEWLSLLSDPKNGSLDREISYEPGPDDNGSSQSLLNIALQLNYHAILHRAEIGVAIRAAGFEPPHVDYIYYLPPMNADHPRTATS